MRKNFRKLHRFYPNRLILVLFAFILFPTFQLYSQYNYFSSNVFFQKDSITKERRKVPPNKVLLRSAILPGWGQATNRQYWKMPVLYAGAGVCVYSLNYNFTRYIDFRDAYRIRTDDDPNTLDVYDPLLDNGEDKYSSADQLKRAREYYRRNFELMVIVTTGVYALNLLDAYISAHLSDFDISDDLSLDIIPPVIYNFAGIKYSTFGINVHF